MLLKSYFGSFNISFTSFLFFSISGVRIFEDVADSQVSIIILFFSQWDKKHVSSHLTKLTSILAWWEIHFEKALNKSRLLIYSKALGICRLSPLASRDKKKKKLSLALNFIRRTTLPGMILSWSNQKLKAFVCLTDKKVVFIFAL